MNNANITKTDLFHWNDSFEIGLFVYCKPPCGGGTGNPSPTL